MEEEPKFDQWQYDFLKRCAEKKDMTEWNRWRENNPNVEIKLRGADFKTGFPQGAYLWKANLQGAMLSGANLQDAKFIKADLQGARLSFANLQGAMLFKTNLQDAGLREAKLQGADLRKANLQGAMLWYANLQGAYFFKANLQGASLREAKFQGAGFRNAKLQGTYCKDIFVNDSTVLNGCQISRQTDFRGVALDVCHIDSNTKALLKRTTRRLNWEEWYKKRNCIIKLPVWLFWELSDYGKSPKRLICTFFGLSFFFAQIYFWFPGLVDKLHEPSTYPIHSFYTFIRAWYFSIVTTTTLGFGDMYAQPGSFLGHILLSLQVIIGYFILGALITYLGILYNSDGPAGRYADEVGFWRMMKHYYRRLKHGLWRMLRKIRGL